MKRENGIVLHKQTDAPLNRIKFAHVTQGSNFIEIFEIFTFKCILFNN